jgi:hypothetical protein
LEPRQGPYSVFYGCPHWPNCDIIGVISPQDKKFRISDQKTRDARKRAHAALDPLWQGGYIKRSQMYIWLAERLNLPKQEMHIEFLTPLECDIVVLLCDQKRREIKTLKVLGKEPETVDAPKHRSPSTKRSRKRWQKRCQQRRRARKAKKKREERENA